MMHLTRMLAKDGEGASKLIECVCKGAPSQDDAITVAKSVIGSTLFKCAIFGEDANWGRILCAVGYADAEFDISKVDVDLKSEYAVILHMTMLKSTEITAPDKAAKGGQKWILQMQ